MSPALDRYLEQFLFCCGYTEAFGRLLRSCPKLLSDLPGKGAEPIALASGTPVRTL